MPKPWQDLLDLIADKPPKTRAEMVAGKMALIRHKVEEEQEAWKTMMNWDTFDAQIQGYAGSADADTLFRLEDFTKLNTNLVETMHAWSIRNIQAAVVRLTHEETRKEVLRVKAITPLGNVIFDEDPDKPFPSEELMTKLQLINPGDSSGGNA